MFARWGAHHDDACACADQRETTRIVLNGSGSTCTMPALVQRLIECNADVNSRWPLPCDLLDRTLFEMPLLTFAALTRNYQVVDALLTARAEPNVPVTDMRSPFTQDRTQVQPDARAPTEEVVAVDCGANRGRSGWNGRTALEIAASFGIDGVVEVLRMHRPRASEGMRTARPRARDRCVFTCMGMWASICALVSALDKYHVPPLIVMVRGPLALACAVKHGAVADSGDAAMIREGRSTELIRHHQQRRNAILDAAKPWQEKKAKQSIERMKNIVEPQMDAFGMGPPRDRSKCLVDILLDLDHVQVDLASAFAAILALRERESEPADGGRAQAKTNEDHKGDLSEVHGWVNVIAAFCLEPSSRACFESIALAVLTTEVPEQDWELLSNRWPALRGAQGGDDGMIVMQELISMAQEPDDPSARKRAKLTTGSTVRGIVEQVRPGLQLVRVSADPSRTVYYCDAVVHSTRGLISKQPLPSHIVLTACKDCSAKDVLECLQCPRSTGSSPVGLVEQRVVGLKRVAVMSRDIDTMLENVCCAANCSNLASVACSTCGIASYCCQEHRLSDWEDSHKLTCIRKVARPCQGPGEIRFAASAMLAPPLAPPCQWLSSGSDRSRSPAACSRCTTEHLGDLWKVLTPSWYKAAHVPLRYATQSLSPRPSVLATPREPLLTARRPSRITLPMWSHADLRSFAIGDKVEFIHIGTISNAHWQKGTVTQLWSVDLGPGCSDTKCWSYVCAAYTVRAKDQSHIVPYDTHEWIRSTGRQQMRRDGGLPAEIASLHAPPVCSRDSDDAKMPEAVCVPVENAAAATSCLYRVLAAGGRCRRPIVLQTVTHEKFTELSPLVERLVELGAHVDSRWPLPYDGADERQMSMVTASSHRTGSMIGNARACGASACGLCHDLPCALASRAASRCWRSPSSQAATRRRVSSFWRELVSRRPSPIHGRKPPRPSAFVATWLSRATRSGTSSRRWASLPHSGLSRLQACSVSRFARRSRWRAPPERAWTAIP